MLAFCHWIDRTRFFLNINGSTPFSILMEVVHYFSVFIIVGSMGIVDLRILGLLGRRQNISDLAQDLLPWMWIGVIMSTISGVIMFTAEATAFYWSEMFRIKILLVILAVVMGIIVNQNAPKWGRFPSVPTGVKVIAFLAIMLWIGALIAGVETPAQSATG
jgi:hypothetical protein